jgi:parallel beta-helix repeat protein
MEKERKMAIPRLGRLILSVLVAALLASALWLLANRSPAAVLATAGALFAKPAGSGSVCTQAAPCTLQTAAAQALAGDVVYLAAGTYVGTGAGAVVTVTRGFTLYGGWDGATAGPVWRDPHAYRSVIDGQNARQGVLISGTFTAGLDGLTITSGKAERGGGIYVKWATVFIRNNVITACQTITDSSYAFGRGGGICLQSVTGGVIANNQMTNNASGYGAGIYAGDSTDITIEGNEISANGAAQNGGGVMMDFSSGLIRGNRFANNRATYDGGGALLWDADCSLDGNRFINNSAGSHGAGLWLGNGSGASLANNWIIQSSGDGIYEEFSSPRLVNNTIVGSGTPNGRKGIWLRSMAGDSPPYAMTEAVVNNIVGGFDYGIYAGGSVTPTLDYNDVWNNRLNNYNLPAHVVSGTHSISVDPRFANPAQLDYHLRADSPCIDAGDPAGVPPAPPTDIDGNGRPLGARVDIGADEFAGTWHVFLPLLTRRAVP